MPRRSFHRIYAEIYLYTQTHLLEQRYLACRRQAKTGADEAQVRVRCSTSRPRTLLTSRSYRSMSDFANARYGAFSASVRLFHSSPIALVAGPIAEGRSPWAQRALTKNKKADVGRLGKRSSTIDLGLTWRFPSSLGLNARRRLRALLALLISSGVWDSTQALYAALFLSLFASAVSWRRYINLLAMTSSCDGRSLA